MTTPYESAGWMSTVADREQTLLAPYAMFSADCRGRRHQELDHPYRGPYQRDRDRIVHSAAFRRLSGKMQVFTGDMGDYHRTRLTHTHEVASIARTMGRTLSLNEDLIEALALFHDIGHPPFGHAGEEALNAKLNGFGGFSHNQQALTIAQELEHRYQRFAGLNLTRDVLDGQAMRCDKSWDTVPIPFEVQVVDVADSIAYNAHDLDDALKLGLVEFDDLQMIPLIRDLVRRAKDRYGPLSATGLRKAIVHELIDVQVCDVLSRAAQSLNVRTPTLDINTLPAVVRIELPPAMARQRQELEQFLYAHVYRHQQLMEIRRSAQDKLECLFDTLMKHVDRLPAKFQRRAQRIGLHRSVADYLAGMTDRYCEAQFTRICVQHAVG